MKLDDYNKIWVDMIEDPNFSTRLNEVKVSAKPMRTGKNYSESSFRIPYLITKKDIRLHIMTSPLSGIILENQESLEDLCTDNEWKYEEQDLEKILRNLEKGYPCVAYFTNTKCFTQSRTVEFIEELKKLGLLPYVSLNVDEFDTWTLSHFSKAAETKGYSIPNESSYRASMYNFTSELAKYSPYTFGMTATPSLEVKGIVDTYGDLNYTLINPLVAGEQKQYANTVAHIGESTFYNFADNLVGENEIQKTVGKMLSSRLRIETITRLKRVAMIQCGDDTKDEKGYGQSPNPTEVIKYIQAHSNLLPHKEEVGIVMTSDEKYSFDINGEVVHRGLTESQVYKRINDLTDPICLFIVKKMAGRGITLPPVKELMTVRIRDPKTKHGSPTESAEQFKGRGKSVYVGESQPKFWPTYKSILNCPGYQELANTYNTYEPDTPMYRESDRNHRLYDACTSEMSNIDIEICPTCGTPLIAKHNHSIIDDNCDGISEALKISSVDLDDKFVH